MAIIKIRIGGKWVTLSGGEASVLEAAKSYTDGIRDALAQDIGNLQESIQNAEDYIDNAFRDGVITETEARRIKTYLNTVQTSKNSFDQRTATILNNPALPPSRKSRVQSVKGSFDTAYTSLINAINSAIADNKVDTGEVTDVDTKFDEYNNAVTLLVEQLELALDDTTQSKLDSSIQYSSTFTNEMKSALNMDVSIVENNLRIFEDYLKTASADGIIYDAEMTKVNNYIKSLEGDKIVLNNRYTIISNNENLTEELPKNNLILSKGSLDTAYESLTTAIDSIVVSDQLVNSSEMLQLSESFNDFRGAISLFSASSESAINSIVTEKGKKANANAQIYANSEKSALVILEKDITDTLSILNSDMELAFNDGTINETELQTIRADLDELRETKENYEGKYNSIYNDDVLSVLPKTELGIYKTTFDESYQDFVYSVNTAIADGFITQTEETNVNLNLSDLVGKLTDLTNELNSAVDYIAQKKADNAEFGVGNYTDQKLIAVDERISKTESAITQTNEEISLRVTKTEYTETITTLESKISGNTQDITDVKNNVVYKVEIHSSNGLVFTNGNLNTILVGKVYYGKLNVTETLDASRFIWTRLSDDTEGDEVWNRNYGIGVKQIVVTSSDVIGKATFNLAIQDEEVTP